MRCVNEEIPDSDPCADASVCSGFHRRLKKCPVVLVLQILQHSAAIQ